VERKVWLRNYSIRVFDWTNKGWNIDEGMEWMRENMCGKQLIYGNIYQKESLWCSLTSEV